MAPRANFLCDACHEDYELPISAKQCPICAGEITRLFDTVNVATGLGVTRAADRMTQPNSDARDKVKNERVERAQRERELTDRVEHALPQVNQQMAQRGMSPISAGQAIGMVDQAGRQASRMTSSILFGGSKPKHIKIQG